MLKLGINLVTGRATEVEMIDEPMLYKDLVKVMDRQVERFCDNPTMSEFAPVRVLETENT